MSRANSLTLESLANARGLDASLLRRLGWAERGDSVAIPWPTTTGRPAWHLRHCLDSQPGRPRWTWSGFDRTTLLPYGADRLRRMREHSETIAIVEGEADALALWTTALPALATGSAGGWQARWWELVKGFERVAVWLEDGGGLPLLRAVLQTRPSDGPEVLVAHNLGGPKDPGRILAACNGDGRGILRRRIEAAVPVEPVADLLQGVVARLRAEKQPGGGYSARCPFHDDRHPSLSVFKGDDGAWAFKCHSGRCGVAGPLTLLAAVLGLVESPTVTALHPLNTCNCNDERPVEVPADELGPVYFHGRPEPPPRQYILGRFLPEKLPVLLYGAGGSLKSLLAMVWGLCVAAGVSFCGFPTRQRPVGYVDLEFDQDEQHRRALALARGLGLADVPPTFAYFPAVGRPLSEVWTALERWTAAHPDGLLIVDSFGLLAAGADTKDEATVIPLMQRLLALRPGGLLIVDHQSKMQPGEDYALKSPYGSVYKENIGRVIWQAEVVAHAPGRVSLMLRPRKNNLGPLGDEVGLGVTFGDGTITVQPAELSAPEFAERAGLKVRLLAALREYGAATAASLAERLEAKASTVKVRLSELKAEGRVVEVGHQGRETVWGLPGESPADPQGSSSLQRYSTNRECNCNDSPAVPGEGQGRSPEDPAASLQRYSTNRECNCNDGLRAGPLGAMTSPARPHSPSLQCYTPNKGCNCNDGPANGAALPPDTDACTCGSTDPPVPAGGEWACPRCLGRRAPPAGGETLNLREGVL